MHAILKIECRHLFISEYLTEVDDMNYGDDKILTLKSNLKTLFTFIYQKIPNSNFFFHMYPLIFTRYFWKYNWFTYI